MQSLLEKWLVSQWEQGSRSSSDLLPHPGTMQVFTSLFYGSVARLLWQSWILMRDDAVRFRGQPRDRVRILHY